MKRILIVLDEATYNYIKKIKDQNKHTWEDCIRAYADIYKVKS